MSELNEQNLSGLYHAINQGLDSELLARLLAVTSDLTTQDVFSSFVYGGYPQPVLGSQDRVYYKTWMENYFKTYVERDIRALFPKLDGLKYRRFINMLTSHSGTIINRSQFGRSLDVNESTVKNYLDIANGTMIWRSIASYEKSTTKSIIKMPKGVFRDSGLCHYLQGINNFEKLHNSSLVGQNFESFVIEELIRGFHASDNVSLRYFYYRTKSGSEVDLILEGDFGTLPVEIKYGSSTRPKQLVGLKKFLKDQNLPWGIVVNNADQIELVTDNIIQVPARFI